MKKVLSLVLSSVVALSLFAGCTKTAEPTETPGGETPGTEEPAEEPAEAGAIVKLGLGIKSDIGKSKDLTDGAATGQVDSVIVAAGFDKDGKIVSITIDTAQDKVGFDGEMKLTSDTSVAGKSKLELGDEYGMKGASSIGKEWFEQIEAFGAWTIGKTVEEVKALELVDNVTTNEELTASVTIKLNGYIAALEEAYANTIDVDGAEKVGLGIVTSTEKSKSMEGETMALAQVDSTVVATALKADGTIAGTIIDAAQTKIAFDKDGKVTNDKAAEVKSKTELGEEYGMKGASSIGKEWFEQSKALAEYMVGKKVADVTGMELAENVPAIEDLKSSVTIKVNGYLAALEKAANNAR